MYWWGFIWECQMAISAALTKTCCHDVDIDYIVSKLYTKFFKVISYNATHGKEIFSELKPCCINHSHLNRNHWRLGRHRILSGKCSKNELSHRSINKTFGSINASNPSMSSFCSHSDSWVIVLYVYLVSKLLGIHRTTRTLHTFLSKLWEIFGNIEFWQKSSTEEQKTLYRVYFADSCGWWQSL